MGRAGGMDCEACDHSLKRTRSGMARWYPSRFESMLSGQTTYLTYIDKAQRQAVPGSYRNNCTHTSNQHVYGKLQHEKADPLI